MLYYDLKFLHFVKLGETNIQIKLGPILTIFEEFTELGNF